MIGEPPVDQKNWRMIAQLESSVRPIIFISILGTSTCKNISTCCQLLVLSVGVHKRLLKGSLSHGV